jgi:hypothetical protein
LETAGIGNESVIVVDGKPYPLTIGKAIPAGRGELPIAVHTAIAAADIKTQSTEGKVPLTLLNPVNGCGMGTASVEVKVDRGAPRASARRVFATREDSDYLEKHQLPALIDDLVTEVEQNAPADPLAFIEYRMKEHNTMQSSDFAVYSAGI